MPHTGSALLTGDASVSVRGKGGILPSLVPSPHSLDRSPSPQGPQCSSRQALSEGGRRFIQQRSRWAVISSCSFPSHSKH